MANNVIFRRGTSLQYNELGEKNQDTLYFLSDTQELYVGSTLFGAGKPATEDKDGLMSAEDKKTLKTLASGTALGLKAVDKSIVVTTKAEAETEIKVGISTKVGQALKLDVDETTGGLYVPDVKYQLVKKDDAGTYASVYQLKCTSGDGEPTFDSVEIEIPKDMVVEKGEVKEVTEDNKPYSGAKKGETYIQLDIANGSSDPIYIPCKDLIDGGDFVKRLKTSSVGESTIENDVTGGGMFFTRTADKLQGAVVVNNGELANNKPSPVAQLYAATNDGSGKVTDGSFLSVYHDKITYTSRAHAKAGGKLSEDDSELVVKRDLQPLVKTKINGSNGTAEIVNEGDGGCLKFTDSYGKVSRISVHDGTGEGTNGVMAQIQAGTIDERNHNTGTTLTVFEDKITYRNKKNNTHQLNEEDLELATLGDLKGISGSIEWQTISGD